MTIALAGCSDVDDALFGPAPAQQTAQAGDTTAQPANPDNPAPPPAEQPAPDASTPPAAPPPDQTAQASAPPPEPPAPSENEGAPPPAEDNSQMASAPESEAPPAPSEEPGVLPSVETASASSDSSPMGSALGSTITAINIESGRDTGTAVSKTLAGLRSQISELDSKMVESARRLGELRETGRGAIAHYQDARAKIMTHLQMGTTRGNPELVTQWNDAQGALDQLSANLNAVGALGAVVANDANSVRETLQQIAATDEVPGAVDEDHRQLTVLEDETRQMVVSYDRLRKDVSLDVPRQTNFVANERANLAQLAGAIKRGELYSSAGGASYAGLSSSFASADPTKPLVVIKFDHPDVSYQQILLAALKQALKTRPSANFKVVAIAPTRGSEDDVEKAQNAAEKHAQDVLRSITDMGVPATRLQVASATDPAARVSEVQVFVI